jgi:hypothetical protein
MKQTARFLCLHYENAMHLLCHLKTLESNPPNKTRLLFGATDDNMSNIFSVFFSEVDAPAVVNGPWYHLIFYTSN